MALNCILQFFLWSLSFYSVSASCEFSNVLPEREYPLDTFFYDPVSYDGKNYYMSVNPFHTTNSEGICNLIGGYLVRIDDRLEQQVVVNLYTKHKKPGALISGTRIGNKWLYQGTNDVMNYTSWANGEPNNVCGVENCIVLWSQLNDMMTDTACFVNPYHFPFVCEVSS